jgi:hypothetical protein
MIAASIFMAGSVFAQQPDQERKSLSELSQEAMMQTSIKLATPGEHHEHLKAMLGTWDLAGKVWESAGAPPTEWAGTSEMEMILGGRFLQQKVKGTMNDQPFEGFGITGYDNFKKKYVSIWIDNMSTAMILTEGTCGEEGKVQTSYGEFIDPMTKLTKKCKTITRIQGDDKFVFEWYELSAEGKEPKKTMEIRYTRR